ENYRGEKLLHKTQTNNDGIFVWVDTVSQYYTRKYARIKKGDDEVIYPINAYRQDNYNEKNRNKVSIFCDRAIYRPGQTLMYKAILFNGAKSNFAVVADKNLRIEIKDVNYKTIAAETLKTNDFGSVSGEFKLPEDILTGNFQISATVVGTGDRFNCGFKVEEYKRPNFEISLQNVTDEVSFGDKVSVKGSATTYSGIPLGNAKVNFDVECSTFSWWYRPDNDIRALASGTVETNENGEFVVDFVANQCFNGINKYSVNVVVSDINGESHDAKVSFMISDQSLWLSSSVGKNVEASDFNGFSVYAHNVSGNEVGAVVDVELFRLEELQSAKVKNCVEVDTNMYSLEKWQSALPFIEYGKEIALENRKTLKKVISTAINTADTTFFALPARLETGSYRLILKTADKNGREVSETCNFNVYDAKSTQMPYTASDFIVIPSTACKVGDTICIRIGSSFDNVNAYYSVQKNQKNIETHRLSINNEVKNIYIPVTEDCDGGISINAFFVREKNKFSASQFISIDRDDKALDVKLVTFRDKTLPGSEESWKIKITGKNGEPANAELLTTIYDASLDSYAQLNWSLNPYSTFSPRSVFGINGFGTNSAYYYKYILPYSLGVRSAVPEVGFYGALDLYYRESMLYRNGGAHLMFSSAKASDLSADMVAVEESETEAVAAAGIEVEDDEFEVVEVRSNFSETALFAPDLTTDGEGNIFLNFTMPQSLTRWKMLGIAHSKDMKIGRLTHELVTQKQVSLTPNLPRFLREGDKMTISAKVSNLTDGKLGGKAKIEFLNAENYEDVTEKFLKDNIQTFEVASSGNANIEWEISVPRNIGSVFVRIVAVGGEHSDGEEKCLPILPNRMLVTETMPLPVRKPGNTNFVFRSMTENESKTLENYSLTLEFTPNPAWYAVLALPYMMEYPHECAEQTFSRFYSNTLARTIANSTPEISKTFEKWKDSDADALKSMLNRNEELKSVIVENSPWLLDAEGDEASKRNIAVLFDTARVDAELLKAVSNLKKMQSSNGGFPWFSGMKDNLYITQYI
ncbi:MAG: hypothetical protein HUK15_07070, partial [Bacteroidales bacterium]|nr:hypothetical protein [Bacteroidales bacterium]